MSASYFPFVLINSLASEVTYALKEINIANTCPNIVQ